MAEARIRPMLAYSEPVTPEELDFSKGPFWLSPKLDGIRSLHMDTVLMSRTLKRIPNRYAQACLGSQLLNGLDGELIVGDETHPNVYNATTSGIMSVEGKPDFTFRVFDLWDIPDVGYASRLKKLRVRCRDLEERGFRVRRVQQTLCETVEEARSALDEFYLLGYEGGIFRSYNDRYKYNRSTLRESYMLKAKESKDSEIKITGFMEMMHNDNEATVDERGFTKRSTHKANKRGAGTLGKLLGIDVHTGQPVTIGTGKMTADEKLKVWLNQDKFMDALAKYRYAQHGIKDLPRHPRWIGWRHPMDL